ncbi:WhiB family transcriptional regulator [Streptomyces sp. NPDC048518]|uniref:WhiB family transcriptional regulator n=1 Tax=Streptomyces sp. NPDC048518 TaxID=3155029 RepID=UPI0033DD909D
MADFSRLPGPNADLWDWQLLAACRGVDSSLFFHPEGERGAARSARENSAKEVCMRCPVRAECAAHALAVREPYGVWGGLTEDEREELMGRARNRLVTTSPTAGSGVSHTAVSHNAVSHHAVSHGAVSQGAVSHSAVSHS